MVVANVDGTDERELASQATPKQVQFLQSFLVTRWQIDCGGREPKQQTGVYLAGRAAWWPAAHRIVSLGLERFARGGVE